MPRPYCVIRLTLKEAEILTADPRFARLDFYRQSAGPRNARALQRAMQKILDALARAVR